jgi:hypothetical protein
MVVGEGLVELLERAEEAVTLSGTVVEDACDLVAAELGQCFH